MPSSLIFSNSTSSVRAVEQSAPTAKASTPTAKEQSLWKNSKSNGGGDVGPNPFPRRQKSQRKGDRKYDKRKPKGGRRQRQGGVVGEEDDGEDEEEDENDEIESEDESDEEDEVDEEGGNFSAQIIAEKAKKAFIAAKLCLEEDVKILADYTKE